MFKIKFNGAFHEITQHKTDTSLFCMNDIHKASGNLSEDEPNYFTRQLSSPKKGTLKTVTGKGKKQGTFADKKTCYKYAAWISNKREDDDEFYDAVFECFDAAANGDGEGAVNAAASVVITPEMIREVDLWKKALRQVVRNNTTFYKLEYAYAHFFDLACKAATGYTSKQLTDGRSAKVLDPETGKMKSCKLSAAHYIILQEHRDCLGAYLASLQILVRYFRSGGTDYHMAAFLLGITTKKNNDLLSTEPK